MNFPPHRKTLKFTLFAFISGLLSSIAFGVLFSEQLTPQTLDKQPFKFTIVPGQEGTQSTFKITVESTAAGRVVETVQGQLYLEAGGKRIAVVSLEKNKIDNGVRFATFFVSAECLDKSTFSFGVYSVANGIAIPGGSSFWFYLKDFAVKKQGQ